MFSNTNLNSYSFKKYFVDGSKGTLSSSDQFSDETLLIKKFQQTSQEMLKELKNYYLSPKEKNLRRETIKVFFRPNDLEFYNLNKKTGQTKMELNKNSTLQEVFLTKKKTEELFHTAHRKGNIYINDLWSEDYYKKVMKFAHLQEIIEDIKENQRKKNIKRKAELLKKIEEENENKKLIFLETSDYMNKSTRKLSISKGKKLPSLSLKKNLPMKYFIKEKINNVKNIINKCEKFSNFYKNEDDKGNITERKNNKNLNHNQHKLNKSLTESLKNFFEHPKRMQSIKSKNDDKSSFPSINIKN